MVALRLRSANLVVLSCLRHLMYWADNGKERSTPRIVRAIRQNSKKRELLSEAKILGDHFKDFDFQFGTFYSRP